MTTLQFKLGSSAFAENCKYLPAVSPSSPLKLMGTPDVFGYEEQDCGGGEGTEVLRRIYNRVAMQTWDVCPVGWHVPTYAQDSGQGEFHGLLAW